MKNKFLHQLMDMVLEKEPGTPVAMNVMTLACTTEVWLYELKDGKMAGVKTEYEKTPDGWRKWENHRMECVSEADVLEALRNA